MWSTNPGLFRTRSFSPGKSKVRTIVKSEWASLELSLLWHISPLVALSQYRHITKNTAANWREAVFCPLAMTCKGQGLDANVRFGYSQGLGKNGVGMLVPGVEQRGDKGNRTSVFVYVCIWACGDWQRGLLLTLKLRRPIRGGGYRNMGGWGCSCFWFGRRRKVHSG